jgi:N-acetyl-gamma-glutamyl-phosphate reductase
MQQSKKALVIGAGSFVGRELLRLLVMHPNFLLEGAISSTFAGQEIAAVYTELEGFVGTDFSSSEEWDWHQLKKGEWILFCALAHGHSMEFLPAILDRFSETNLQVVDLSGDFRLGSSQEYSDYYGKKHTSPGWLPEFAYGLPEFEKEKIISSRLTANPGCFATAAQLATRPLAFLKQPPQFIAIDGKTGSSGAGIFPGSTTHHPLRANNFRAYKADGHQHYPEIKQGWKISGGSQETEISFVPHMTPLVRGIFTTVHAFFPEGLDRSELRKHFDQVYAESPLVKMMDESPAIGDVSGTSRCDISVHVQGRCAVVCAALDNLLGGAAGRAIQNANLMSGWQETAGLLSPPSRPV